MKKERRGLKWTVGKYITTEDRQKQKGVNRKYR